MFWSVDEMENLLLGGGGGGGFFFFILKNTLFQSIVCK